MNFLAPEYFLLSIPIALYVLWAFFSKDRETTLSVSNIQNFQKMPPSLRVRLLSLPVFLRTFALLSVMMMLARPVGKISWHNTEVEGIDIMLAIDVSTSMLAEDLKPNRIESAKAVAKEFVNNRKYDNIGLTLFAADAFTQCPLTIDHNVLQGFLQNATCNMALHGLINDGTAIGMGIMNAISRLQKSKAKSKVIILLTDGSNNQGDVSPLTAAEVAKSFGIRIYTIGVGAKGMAPYPYPLPGGGVHYVLLPSDVEEGPLQEIASLTNGTFYRATSSEELRKIYRDIDRLERTKFNARKYDTRYELFQYFAAVALLFLFLELLLKAMWLRRFS